jgi:hypothetical protein
MSAARMCCLSGLAVLVLLGGCGGDDGLSREEFISAAEAICDEYDQRVDEVDEPEGVDDIERYVNEVRPVVVDGFSELEALQPPAELEEQWDELMAARDETLEVLDDLDEAGANGDLARIQEITEEASRRDGESDRIAREIGVQKCSGTGD